MSRLAVLQVSDAREIGHLCARTDSAALPVSRIARLSARDGVTISEPTNGPDLAYAEVAIVARSVRRRPIVRSGAFAFALIGLEPHRHLVEAAHRQVPRFLQGSMAGADYIDAAFGIVKAFLYDAHVDIHDNDVSTAYLEDALRTTRALLVELGEQTGVAPTPLAMVLASRDRFTVLSHDVPGAMVLTGWGSMPRIATSRVETPVGPAACGVLGRGVVLGDDLPTGDGTNALPSSPFVVSASGFRRPMDLIPA